MNYLWMEPVGNVSVEAQPQMCTFKIADTGVVDFTCYDRFQKASNSYLNRSLFNFSGKISSKCQVSFVAFGPTDVPAPWFAEYTWTGYMNTSRDGVVGNLVHKKTKRIFPFQMARIP